METKGFIDVYYCSGCRSYCRSYSDLEDQDQCSDEDITIYKIAYDEDSGEFSLYSSQSECEEQCDEFQLVSTDMTTVKKNLSILKRGIEFSKRRTKEIQLEEERKEQERISAEQKKLYVRIADVESKMTKLRQELEWLGPEAANNSLHEILGKLFDEIEYEPHFFRGGKFVLSGKAYDELETLVLEIKGNIAKRTAMKAELEDLQKDQDKLVSDLATGNY